MSSTEPWLPTNLTGLAPEQVGDLSTVGPAIGRLSIGVGNVAAALLNDSGIDLHQHGPVPPFRWFDGKSTVALPRLFGGELDPSPTLSRCGFWGSQNSVTGWFISGFGTSLRALAPGAQSTTPYVPTRGQDPDTVADRVVNHLTRFVALLTRWMLSPTPDGKLFLAAMRPAPLE